MKKWNIIIAVLLLPMLLLTVYSCLSISKGLFTSVINPQNFRVIGSEVLWIVLFFVCSLLSFFALKFRKRKEFIFVFFTFFFIWINSGRVISISTFPDPKVISGWFYLKTNEFSLCGNDSDCETSLSNTRTKVSNMFRIQIKNDVVDKTLFVGPFIERKSIKETFE